MVGRRRWQLCMMALLAGVVTAAAQAAPTAKDFETTSAKELPDKVTEVLKSGPTGAAARETWAETVICPDFTKGGQGVNSPRAEVRLNSAMLMCRLDALKSDKTLEKMLENTDPTVRYWAARGLANLSVRVLKVGGATATDAINALTTAVKAEKSGVVTQEIVKALANYGASSALVDALDAITKQMAAGTPEVSLLQTAGIALDKIAPWVSTAAAADKVRAAGGAANVASFAAQQQAKYDDSLKAMDATATLPADYVSATQKVVESATAVCKAAGAASLTPPTGSSSKELLMNVNTTFGGEGKAGDVQKAIKSVPVPAKIAGQ